MPRLVKRTHANAGGRTWIRHWRFGRVQFGWDVWQHYSHHGDRWLFKPFVVFDRKPARED